MQQRWMTGRSAPSTRRVRLKRVVVGTGLVCVSYPAYVVVDALISDGPNHTARVMPWHVVDEGVDAPALPAAAERLAVALASLGTEESSWWFRVKMALRAVRQFTLFGSSVLLLALSETILPTPLHGFAQRHFVWTLETCGPFAIKLGQWLAGYSTIFGAELCRQLEVLQADAPRHTFVETQRVLQSQLGDGYMDVFDFVEERPLASGSVAQVHRAEIDGRPVVLKVRHPGAVDAFRQDIRLLLLVARVGTWLSPALVGSLRPAEVVADFSSIMVAQLDLKVEAENLLAFRRNFAGRSDVTFPEPLMDLCGDALLVETFEEGLSVKAFASEPACDRRTRNLLARSLVRTYLKMALADNFSHDDMHAGNVLVRWVPDTRSAFKRCTDHAIDTLSSARSAAFDQFPGNERREREMPPPFSTVADEVVQSLPLSTGHPRGPPPGMLPCVVLLDAGVVTQLTATDWRNFYDLFKAFFTGQTARAASLMVDRVPKEKLPATPLQVETFKREVKALLDELMGASLRLRRVGVGSTLMAVTTIARENCIPLDSVFTSRFLGTFIVEALGRELNPDMDFLTEGAAQIATDRHIRRQAVRDAAALLLHEARMWRTTS